MYINIQQKWKDQAQILNCGAADKTGSQLENVPFMTTHWDLIVRKSFSHHRLPLITKHSAANRSDNRIKGFAKPRKIQCSIYCRRSDELTSVRVGLPATCACMWYSKALLHYLPTTHAILTAMTYRDSVIQSLFTVAISPAGVNNCKTSIKSIRSVIDTLRSIFAGLLCIPA